MREIKFRAWDTYHKVMRYNKDIPPILAKNLNVENDQWKFLQFTGLTDKNGKEIYEGDIVERKSWFSDSNGVTRLSDDNSYMQRRIVEFEAGKVFQGYRIQENDEVIGNIHENPELLENKTPAL